MADVCWYCHDDFRVEDWLLDGQPAPLCRLHSATTRAALVLRDCGENDAADDFDEAIGIDTRPMFSKFVDPLGTSPAP